MEAAQPAPNGTTSFAKPHGSAIIKTPKLVEAAKAFAAAAKAKNTRKAYRADWKTFTEWCRARRVSPLPATPEAVALHLAHRATPGAKVSTISRALVAISQLRSTCCRPLYLESGLSGVFIAKAVRETDWCLSARHTGFR
jgi:hypothetical protein